jgi:hypothetical protein
MDYTYHFIYHHPDLAADWLFTAGRRYWIHFRPFVTSDLDVIQYVYHQPQFTVAITSLARRDVAPKIAEEIKQRFPNAYFDPLVYDYVEEMRLTLDGRAEYQQRFGIIEPPTPTPTPIPLVVGTPTYGARIIGANVLPPGSPTTPIPSPTPLMPKP